MEATPTAPSESVGSNPLATASSTSTTSGEEAQQRPQPPTEPMARGIYELFAPIVHEYDARVQAVLQTQEQLAKQIDRLSSELNAFSAVATTPPLGQSIHRIRSAKERITVINSNLTQILARLDRLERAAKPDSKKPKSLLDIFTQ
eukprot:TRINITY_DN5911_c0_g1_i1.p1 TRINITY_DN5911_c0_g1~~TRINITY_DN5911_c0_g1_i1.p1  ORF type:complete len:146 (+),score=38.29 TRINITY_DN5911_c0_g1_i1:208-645(+)